MQRRISSEATVRSDQEQVHSHLQHQPLIKYLTFVVVVRQSVRVANHLDPLYGLLIRSYTK